METERLSSRLDCVFRVSLLPFDDARGTFLKVLHLPTLRGHGFEGNIAETYVARSRRDVLRGFHLQVGPCAHSKLVVCLEGAVLDVALDVRPNSATFGASVAFELNADRPELVHLGPGIAHAYLVISESALVLNATTAAYCSEHEMGWRWDSVDVWPHGSPIVSEKDHLWPRLPHRE